MNNPFDLIEDRLLHIEALLEKITNKKGEVAPKSRIVPLEQFCSLGFMKLPTAYMRLSKNGNGIPGAIKIGRLRFVDLDVFEREVRENGGLKSLELR